ncbi:MAG: hypothetical protein ACK4UT_05365 [Moraxellaceae bacterium]
MGRESFVYQQISALDMDGWLHAGDPASEAVITLFRARGLPLSCPLPALRQLAAAGEPSCRQLLSEMETLPDWVDFDLMAK